MMSGRGLLPCLERHYLRPKNGAELPRQFQSRHNLVCDLRPSAVRPGPKVRCLARLRAHTNLDWARRVCVYFGVGITTAVIKREFVNSSQADQASTEPRGTHTCGSMSVRGAITRGTEHPYVRVSCTYLSTPLN